MPLPAFLAMIPALAGKAAAVGGKAAMAGGKMLKGGVQASASLGDSGLAPLALNNMSMLSGTAPPPKKEKEPLKGGVQTYKKPEFFKNLGKKSLEQLTSNLINNMTGYNPNFQSHNFKGLPEIKGIGGGASLASQNVMGIDPSFMRPMIPTRQRGMY